MHKLQADCRAVLPDKRTFTDQGIMAKRLTTTGYGIVLKARSGPFFRRREARSGLDLFVIASASEAVSICSSSRAQAKRSPCWLSSKMANFLYLKTGRLPRRFA